MKEVSEKSEISKEDKEINDSRVFTNYMDDLYKLGLNKEQEEYWKTNFSEYEIGRIASQHRELYKVVSNKGEVLGSICGSLRYNIMNKSDYPAVGDWVAFKYLDNSSITIKGILPRKSILARKVCGNKMEEQILATNIDKIFITMSLNNDFNIRRLERYINIAWDSGATPIIILTKSDVCKDLDNKLNKLKEISIGIDTITVSSLTGEGVDNVKNVIKSKESVVFIGSSGVGKSTLINKLVGKNMQFTNDTGDNDKGRHTTTYRELLALPTGGVIIDTPGMREIQLSKGDVESTFSDIDELAIECYFSDCKHKTEPKCAVREAIENGVLSTERFKSYEKLKKELQYAKERRDRKEKYNIKKAIGGNKNDKFKRSK